MATIPRASADPETPAIAATKVRAVSWATPGIVISRRQATEALAMRLMSASIAATAVITAVRAAIKPAWGRETGEITKIRVGPRVYSPVESLCPGHSRTCLVYAQVGSDNLRVTSLEARGPLPKRRMLLTVRGAGTMVRNGEAISP